MTDRARPRARSPLVHVFAARAGRVAFGAVLVAGAVAMTATARDPSDDVAARVLLATTPIALLLGAVTRRACLMLGPWLSARERAFGGGPTAPVAGLASPSEASTLRRSAGRLEAPSYSLPLVGLALVAPLTLHSPFFFLAPDDGLRDLSQWVRLSLVLTGLAHVTLALLSHRFAMRLRRGRVRSSEREAFAALAITTVAGCLPGVIFAGIPPALVAITGLAFVPASFVVMERACRRERWLLGA